MNKGEQYLVEKCKQGDVEAFEVILNLYEKKIFNFIYRMLGNKEDAQDVAQETFLKAYRSIKTFKGDSSFSTWLFRIAKNACIDYLRKNSKIKTYSLDKPIVVEGEEIKKETPDTSNLPEDVVKRKEIRNFVHKAILELPEKYRTAVILRDIQDLSYKEIAQILNCSIGTVKSRISRGRRELKALIIEVGEQSPLNFV